MREMEIACLLVLISVSAVNNVGARQAVQLHIKPQTYDYENHCPTPCLLLSYLVSHHNEYLRSNTQIVFLTGDHSLSTTIRIFQAENISFIGQHDDKFPTISCESQASSVRIINSVNINIMNLWFRGCGAHYSLEFGTISPYIAAALVFSNCTATQIFNTKFENSIGHSIIMVDTKGTSRISKTSFFHTSQQTGKLLYSGVLVNFSRSKYSCNETTVLVLQQCHFYNFNGKSYEPPPSDRIGTALTIINLPLPSCRGLRHVKVSVMDSSFTKCTCYTRPLINIQLQLHENIRLLFKNVTVSRNRVIVYFLQYQIISLIQITSFETELDNGFQQQVTCKFKHCLISNNTVTGNIFSHKISETRLTNRMMSNFNIDSCIFTHNRAVNGLVVMEYAMVFLSLKNSKFIYNRVCDIHMEMDVIDERLLHVVSNAQLYNSVLCSILTSYHSMISFTGYNEFSFNELNSDYFWRIDDFMILEENTTVNVSSNEVGSVMIEMNNGVFRDKSMFPPCPIQYVSLKGNLDRQFKEGAFLNYSLVFKDNVKQRREGKPNILLRRTFKDCHWLPGTAFKTSHSAAVAKKFVIFDNANDNVVGYPYNGCLCYKASNATNCVTDTIGHVYPGKTIDVGFKLLGIESEQLQKVFQSVLKFWNTNSSCAINLISPSKQQRARTECTYFTFTVTLPPQHQNITECTFVHQYGELLNSMYFVSILPCPPGFMLINGKCLCHPKLERALKLTRCNIDNQTVLRPANTWMMYSNKTGDVIYVEDCPFHYCLSSSLYIQLSDPDKQCGQNRRGILCGQCSEGYSAVFGSTRCRECSNTWLASIAIFMSVGLVLVLCLFNIKMDLKSTNLTSLLLYASILSATRSNIIESGSTLSSSFGFIPISLLNFDLGFELCFYNGMTEYVKLWLQLAFPIYIICLTALLLCVGKSVSFMQRLTKYNRSFTPAVLVLILFSKFPLIFSKYILFIRKLNYLDSTKIDYLWIVNPRTLLFTSENLLYLIFCIILCVTFAVYNLILLCPKWFTRLRNYMQFLDVFKAILKSKHVYWMGLELLLRLIIAALLILDRKLSLLFNLLIVLVFIAYLSITCPFKDYKYTILEWSLLINLIFIFSCSLYYGQNKTKTYYIIVNMIVLCGFLTFSLTTMYNVFIKKSFTTVYSWFSVRTNY